MSAGPRLTRRWHVILCPTLTWAGMQMNALETTISRCRTGTQPAVALAFSRITDPVTDIQVRRP